MSEDEWESNGLGDIKHSGGGAFMFKKKQSGAGKSSQMRKCKMQKGKNVLNAKRLPKRVR